MATTKPRLTVTLPENIHRTLTRLAELQGVSKSAIVVDLLDTVHPPLMRTVALLEAAQDAPQEIKDGLLAKFVEIENELSRAKGIADTQMDFLDATLNLGKEANPHVVTRGSGSGAPPSAAPAKSKKTSGKSRR